MHKTTFSKIRCRRRRRRRCLRCCRCRRARNRFYDTRVRPRAGESKGEGILNWLDTRSSGGTPFRARWTCSCRHACEQCDQIGRFISLWVTFQSRWQQILCPNHKHVMAIFLVKSILGSFSYSLGDFLPVTLRVREGVRVETDQSVWVKRIDFLIEEWLFAKA